jgi:chromosomal replication initiation ATPase DnaA
MNELQRQRASIQAVRDRIAMAAEAFMERDEESPSPERLRRRSLAIKRINRLTEAWQWWRQKKAEASTTIMMLDRAPIYSILRATEKVTGISVEDQKSRRRSHQFAQARQISMYVSCRLHRHSQVSVARHLNQMDHTSVHHGVNKIADLVESDQSIADLVNRVQTTILSKRAF